MNTKSNISNHNNNPEIRNIFVETHFGKPNLIVALLKDFFLFIAIYGSSVVEVFLRKRFGERYFSLSHSVILIFLILYFGNFLSKVLNIENSFIILIIFMIIYLGFSLKHRMEISKYGTTYDYKRFSLSNGEIASFWNKLIGQSAYGVKISEYSVRVVLEPAIPFIVGFILSFFSLFALVGITLMLSAICLAIKNFMQAQIARNWVLDIIDNKIANETKHDLFITGKSSRETKGVYLPIELPKDKQTRQYLYNTFEKETGFQEDIWVNDELDD
ncbi:MAG: hypothetical protein AAF611_17425 [Bacteroidota bacterium]